MDNLQAQLAERLNQNISEYHMALLGLDKVEIIEKAERTALIGEVHSYLTGKYPIRPSEAAYLLNFQNPLEVLTDAYEIQREDKGDLHFIIGHVCESREALRDYPLAEAPDEDRLYALLDENLGAYTKEITALMPQEVFERAGEAAAIQDAHYYLTDVHAFKPGEASYLLSFQNPLEVVADAWRENRERLEDMSVILEDIFDERTRLNRYPLAEGAEPATSDGPAEKQSIHDRLRAAGEQVKHQPPGGGAKDKQGEPR